MGISKKKLSIDDFQLKQWITQFPDTAQAELCVRYALFFNSLNIDWLLGVLARTVTYGSQSVDETLTGQDSVWEYLAGKIYTLRKKPERRPRCELGINTAEQPCVLMYQPQGIYDRSWLSTPLASVQIKADGKGFAADFFMITAVPCPATAKRSGIYPGVAEPVQERAKRFIRPADDYTGLRFAYFLLDGEISLDRRMMEESKMVLEAFPGAASSIFLTTKRKSAADEFDRAGFIGFPAIAVSWMGEIIFRHQGLISADRLIPEIKKMTPLHVVKN